MDMSSIDRLGMLFGSFSEGLKNLHTILDTLPSAVVMVDAAGKFAYVNKRGIELYGVDYSGFEMEDHISKVKALNLNGEQFLLEEMPVSHSLKSGQVIRNVEMVIESADGTRYPVDVSSAPLYDTNGKISGAIVIFEDITERRQKDKELIEVEKRITQRTEDKYRRYLMR